MRPAIIIALGCTFWALSVATVAQPSIQDQPSQSASHDTNTRNKENGFPDTAFYAKQGIPFQSPSAEESGGGDQGGSPKPDWWSRITNALIAFGTLALAVIGSVGAMYALRTLRAIEGQTGELQDSISVARTSAAAAQASADAALLNARAVINAERAWISGDFTSKEIISGITRYSLNIKNLGKTPAQIFEYEIWHGLLTEGEPFSKDRLTTHFSESIEILIAGGDSATLRDDFVLDDLFTMDSGTTAKAVGMQKGAFCVTIKYGDVITEGVERSGHETSFVYECNLLLGSTYRIAQFNRYS